MNKVLLMPEESNISSSRTNSKSLATLVSIKISADILCYISTSWYASLSMMVTEGQTLYDPIKTISDMQLTPGWWKDSSTCSRELIVNIYSRTYVIAYFRRQTVWRHLSN
jgi:hypothetical protein